LVADRVTVASVGAPSAKNPNPSQYVFTSHADEPAFEVYPDPRGNTLGRGTEITLELKSDALEYLDQATLTKLVNTHSVFSTQFPIYLWTTTEDEILVDEDGNEIPIDTEPAEPIIKVKETKTNDENDVDEDDVLVEDVEEEPIEKPEPQTKKITIEEWTQLNTRQPIWLRYVFPAYNIGGTTNDRSFI
jgi:heat shock protein 90kDa beta